MFKNLNVKAKFATWYAENQRLTVIPALITGAWPVPETNTLSQIQCPQLFYWDRKSEFWLELKRPIEELHNFDTRIGKNQL